MVNFEKILFASDLSEFSEYAGKYAMSLAQKYSSKLYVVHVVEPVERFTYTFDFALDYETHYKTMENRAKELLNEIVDSVREKGLDTEGILLSGEPFVEIIKCAREREVDLIVMATHGRTGIEHLLLGSVTEKVLRKSPCPVMVVRRPDHKFVMP